MHWLTRFVDLLLFLQTRTSRAGRAWSFWPNCFTSGYKGADDPLRDLSSRSSPPAEKPQSRLASESGGDEVAEADEKGEAKVDGDLAPREND